MTDRIISLIDMDCFYCQVEARLDPTLVGVPMAVVQYNTWKGGGIIAVNYEARAFGVTRNMRGDEARSKCPDIKLVQVPEVREKADLTKYRNAGKEVIQELLTFGAVVERASVDEAYIDITKLVEKRIEEGLQICETDLPNTFVVGHDEKDEERLSGLKLWLGEVKDKGLTDCLRLAHGAKIVEDMRRQVFEKTQFRCSAGVAHNKMLAKVSCGFHKPNKQTILPHDQVKKLYEKLKISKLRGLGGKLGENVIQDLNCETVGQLAKLSLAEIRDKFEDKTAKWLYDIARGFEYEPVKERDLPKSIGCSKNFLGPKMLGTRSQIEFWLGQLAQEMCERLVIDKETNGRVARGLHVHISQEGKSASRAGQLTCYDKDKVTRQAMSLIANLNDAAKSDATLWRPKVKNLSISASKFEEDFGDQNSIQNLFAKQFAKREKQEENKNLQTSNDKNTFNTIDESSMESFGAASTVLDESSMDSVVETDNNRETSGDSAVSAEDLVPDLENFDASILECLPDDLKDKVKKRVEKLKAESTSNLVECEKCHKKICAFELPEHMDYHMAKDLQRELAEPLEVRTVILPSKKRKSKSNVTGEPSKKKTDIKQFFKKS